jgi:excisionase family DNA binding protein
MAMCIPDPMYKDWLTPKQAAKLLGVSTTTINNWRHQGLLIIHQRNKKHYVIDPSCLNIASIRRARFKQQVKQVGSSFNIS